MREEACRGIDSPFKPPPCNSNLTPDQFQEQGYNTAAVHPPGYYFATAAVASILVAVHGTHDLVTAGRLVGILWLGLGLALTWFAARRLGSGTAARTAVIMMVASAPAVVYYDSIINTDAAAIFAGALVLWATLA
jgi:4-amino-4-deoxy-L-arabinose transferase-like glycosyltransferase